LGWFVVPSGAEECLRTPNVTAADGFSIIIPFYSEEENVEAILQETRRTNVHAKFFAGEQAAILRR
jgi:hypothetical protein